jgi:hypothetical protein
LSRSIADVFREHGADALAKTEASLATDADRHRFLDAARGLLAVDPAFVNQVRGKERTKLISGPIDTPEMEERITAELRHATARLVKEQMPLRSSSNADRHFYLFGMRLLMADIVARGLAPFQRWQTLHDATVFLWEARNACLTAQRKTWGATRSNGAYERDGERTRELWLRATARAWRERNPRASQSAGVRWLYERAKKQKDFTAWSTPGALRSWANRKGIRI